MTNPNPDVLEEEDKNDLIIFPELFASESKSRLLGLYGEVNEEKCKAAIIGLYYSMKQIKVKFITTYLWIQIFFTEKRFKKAMHKKKHLSH